MYKKTLIAILFLQNLMLLNIVHAQTKEPNFMIKGEPLYLINNGLYVDFEKRISNTKWLMVSPQFYVNYKSRNNDSWNHFYYYFLDENRGFYGTYGDTWKRNPYLKVIGIGLDLTIKNFIFTPRFLKQFYLGYGTMWQYYNLTLTKFDWLPYQEGDLNVLLPSNKNYNEQINKFGLNAIFGFQQMVFKGMYLDVYTGFGFRYSYYRSSDNPVVKFNAGMWDFGYTGINFIGGVRVGVGF
jgi:hypothetical protein